MQLINFYCACHPAKGGAQRDTLGDVETVFQAAAGEDEIMLL